MKFRLSLVVSAVAAITSVAAVAPSASAVIRPAAAITSPVGTIDILSDIRAGSNGSSAYGGATLGNLFVFVADDGSSGSELWVTDGTRAGTSLLKDIRLGSSGSNAQHFFVQGNKAFFAADDGSTGSELWVTDGTTAGTTLVKDINSGSNGSGPSKFVRFGNGVVFAATTSTEANEVWISDGTTAGTTMLKNINPNGSSYPGSFFDNSGTLYFSADDGTNGYELWKSDGTTAGTTMVKDLNPGSQYGYANSGYPDQFNAVNGTILFTARDEAHATELWVTDGTANGTNMLLDLNAHISSGSNTESSNPSQFALLGSSLYFVAFGTTAGTELWKTDGTVNGTELVTDLNSGSSNGSPNSSSPLGLSLVGNRLYFFASDGVRGMEPYVSDGTANGTVTLGDLNPGAGNSNYQCFMCQSPKTNFRQFGNQVLFMAYSPSFGAEPWTTDGTVAGTQLVADIRSGSSNSVASTQYSIDYWGTNSYFAVVNGRAIFMIDNGTTGAEPWALYSPPGSPRTVTVSASPNTATVSWLAPTFSGSSAITSYTVTSNPGAFTCTTSTLSCDVTGLLSNQDYTFSVVASSAIGTSVTPGVSSRIRTPSPQLGSLVGSLTSVTDIVSDSNLRRGDSVTVLYRGFNPSEVVLLMLASNPVVIGSANADANGNVSITGTIPSTADLGNHHLVLYAPVSGFGASQAITVAAATGSGTTSAASSGSGVTNPSVDPESLPATGRGDAPAVLALFVLVAGFLAMRLRRHPLPVRGDHPR